MIRMLKDPNGSFTCNERGPPFGRIASQSAYTPLGGGHPVGRHVPDRSRVTGEATLTLPFAALAAVIAALIETSVLAEVPIAGATADLVLVCAAVATLVLGLEDGIVLAFVGGLLVDLLVPGRPIGAATSALLLTVGVVVAAARMMPSSRPLAAVGIAIGLTAVYHVLLAVILVLTQGTPFVLQPVAVIVAAVMNGLLAIPIAAIFGAIERRFGTQERTDW